MQQLPPVHAHETGVEQVRLQALVSPHDKRTLLAAVGDDGIYTYFIAHALRRAANYIRTHDIDCTDIAKRQQLLDFLRYDADTQVARPVAGVDDAGGTARVQRKNARSKSVPGTSHQGHRGGER